MASRPFAEPIQSSNTGGSNTGSQLSSRNPYRDSVDEGVSRNPYHTPRQSPTKRSFNEPTTPVTTQAQALSSHPLQQTAASMSHQEGTQPSAGPPLPAKPAEYQPTPTLPPRSSSQRTTIQETHPGFTPPFHPDDEPLRPPLPARNESFARRVSSADPVGQPPRRRLTTGDIPLTTVPYVRQPTRLVAYLLPLPAPTSQGQTLTVPQRYMLYTPPAPHLLKPVAADDSGVKVKEGKRHRLKRVAQQEMRKAKTYEGRTVSWRGLHSKALRGVDWAVAAIKNADVTFFARVPRKKPAIDELVLIHSPVGVAPGEEQRPEGGEEVQAEFKAQLARVQRKARKDSAISVGLFVPALVIDTLLAIVWPFGGLAEIDGVWAYASLSAWLTARSVSKRLDDRWMTTAGESERLRLGREMHGGEGQSPERSDDEGIMRPVGERPARPESRAVHFQEELDDETDDEKMNADKVNGKKVLRVRFVPDEAMDTMNKYFQEILHKRNPRAFPSVGVPPTKTDVLASIGWWPDRRGRFPGSQQDGDWDDENVSLTSYFDLMCQLMLAANSSCQWQTRQVKEDLDKVMGKAAKDWDKWCKAYAKYPERAMQEKGHSKTSKVLSKLRPKKDAPSHGAQQAHEAGGAENFTAENDTAPGAPASRKTKLLATLQKKREAMFGGSRSPRLKI